MNISVRRVNEQGLPLEGLNYSLRSSLAVAWVNRQGAGRVGAVSRASAQAVAPAPSPAPTPRAEPAPSVEREPTPRAEPRRSPRPSPAKTSRRRICSVTTPGLTPASRRARPPPPPPVEPEAREFVGPDGTRMYGVPNLENDLDESLMQVREAYAELTKRRDKSIDEMEKLFDDYDNF